MADEQIGRGLARFEDGALLTGRGRFPADLPVAAGTLYAALLRSPHAHADIVSIDTSRAVAMAGVQCVVTGEPASSRYGSQHQPAVLADDVTQPVNSFGARLGFAAR